MAKEKQKTEGRGKEKMETKEEKTQEKKEEKKKEEIKPKEKAVVRGRNLRISLKHCKFIFRMLKGKTPKEASKILEEIIKKKIAVPMPGAEVAHKKGRGIAGAKYPEKAAKEVLYLIKQAIANSSVNGIENPVIFIVKADQAPRPYRRGGRRAKRCHVYLEVRDKLKIKGKK